jgi:hypothetical protein
VLLSVLVMALLLQLQARLAGFDTSRFEIGKNFKGA